MFKVLRLGLLLASFSCSTAYANESREVFLDAPKKVSVIDDVEFKAKHWSFGQSLLNRNF